MPSDRAAARCRFPPPPARSRRNHFRIVVKFRLRCGVITTDFLGGKIPKNAASIA